ncbi:uncharacterized protein LOC126967861 [Leptidea sinapis]|uniref:uncharacterized protein LOC126967861 n=1 Tax=Leptidea sinapis TaxID=189913 RepID=UPI0021C421F6|nr:uncharacterized protein LOC126967861 [Leptidea sinapis]
MRWITLMFGFAVASIVWAHPEPKKYKPDVLKKDQVSEKLTDDEKQFIKEVEEKFGVKSEVSERSDEQEEISQQDKLNTTDKSGFKPSFPAVIAIEIVNDTDSKTKGKRTIDANLGYGYRTSNGYSYNYFGKSGQDKGKFMIYPYSQEDIPSGQKIYNSDYVQTDGQYQKTTTNVEIQPSQAYELVPLKDEHATYEYKKPEVEFKTPSPPVNSYSSHSLSPSTLYTTYNGQEFSGLSKQFPTLMPNYFVDPSQLLKNPQYQNAGLTQDHLRPHDSQLGQRIVPVLVLRIPSSSLRNPSAELYANLPNNYPLSSYLNNVNLQQLVNQYFKKQGFSFAPQIMAYQSSHSSSAAENEPHHYADPYVRPAYTQADYSGVQYSAVKPVMARYPLRYNQQKYLLAQPQSVYRPHSSQRPSEYQYQYVPQMAMRPMTYYIQPQYQHQSAEVSQNYHSAANQHGNTEETLSNLEYRTPTYSQDSSAINYAGHQSVSQTSSNYYAPTETEASQYENAEYNKPAVQSEYVAAKPDHSTYVSSSSSSQNDGVSVYPSRLIHTEQYEESEVSSGNEYRQNDNTEEAGKGLVLSENYPSKDHTIATILPLPYSAPKKPALSTIQTVSYVTPMPTSKYQSQYKIMVPQTVFKSLSDEKVSYVNSRTLPMHYIRANLYNQDRNPEEEYTTSAHYVPPVASKTSYPRNYHTHPKRMAKADNKAESSMKVAAKKQSDQNEKKSS